MSAPEIHRDLGRIEAEVATLKDDMAEMKSDVKAIRATLSEYKGGWKVLAAASAAGAALMAAIIKLLPFVQGMR